MGTLAEAFEVSLEEAVAGGRIDPRAQAAPIEAARILARSIDEDCEHAAHVKFPTMLKYCDALGMLPVSDEDAGKKPQTTKLAVMINGSKFAKAANA